ncbi:MAG: hypothetical protein IKN30_08300, partial [Synergistaceae bacterium]|nr:hypothetical protein [Synergistaceae bacterium]
IESICEESAAAETGSGDMIHCTLLEMLIGMHDDLEKNVNAAKKFGFHAIQSVTFEQVREDLNKFLKEAQ